MFPALRGVLEVFRWIIRLLFVVLLARLLGLFRRGPRPPRPEFDPTGGPDRENPRAATPLSPYEIEDADYEELPGRMR